MPNNWAMAKPSGGSSGLGSSEKLRAGFSDDVADVLPKRACSNCASSMSASSAAVFLKSSA